ncbi:L-rhamnose-binding lectin CSL2 [Aethina tumida]|uniref:L-rhamnose-binding lectin CSL2 n=1 Tax=Aethina tumida TaxID=116153 RepID=UPI002147C57A|nr:L-rhamnose-binding lectin CSL2 [Aethina tumida]
MRSNILHSFLVVIHVAFAASQSLEACEGEDLTVQCNSGIINILGANFGRTNSQTCSSDKPSNQITNITCLATGSLSIVQKQCNGVSSCRIPASTSQFGDPCPGTFKYLEVDYNCITDDEPPNTATACEAQTASLSCSVGLINILSANYGRTNNITCADGKATNQITNTNCISTNSLATVKSLCDLKTSCSVTASNTVFTDPCIGTAKFLVISYECQDITTKPTTITGAQSPSTTTCTPPRLTPLQEYLLMMKRFFQQFRPYPQPEPQRPPGFLQVPQIPLEQRFGLSPPQIQPHRPINNLIG